MKEISKKFKILSLITIVLGILGIGFVISADDEAGKIILSKEATKVSENFDTSNQEYGRLANVTLKVEANPYIEESVTSDELDIVLVLDSSGSMSTYVKSGNSRITRLEALQNTATDFVNTMLDDEGKVQIGLVDYDSSVQQNIKLTTSKNTLIAGINKLGAGGGTNLQSGINAADPILAGGRKDAKKLVIILTDGIPTFYTYNDRTCGDGNRDEAAGRNCPTNIKPSDAAKTALDNLKAKYSTADVYTITFGNASGAAEKLAKINPVSATGKTPVYKNVTALDADELKKEFESIQEATKNIVAKEGVVVDEIPKEFKLTQEAKEQLEKQGVEITENSDGTTTLTWSIGDIEAGAEKAKTLSFDVIAKDEYHGSMYTNVTENYKSATLTSTVEKSNPYYPEYQEKEMTLEFNAPTVDIPAITKDDHYNDNPSYVGTKESTITGASILNNDLDKNLSKDKVTADENITVIDKILIEENENTVKISENVYELRDNGEVLGTLTVKEDGTFTFASTDKAKDEVSFNYLIKTTTTRDGKESKVYSNTSKVTLKLVDREKVTVTGEKIWKDNNNQDGIRPENITVVLKNKDTIISEKTISAENNWKYEFTDLPKYEVNHEGEEEYLIKYTVAEKNVVLGYDTTYTTTKDNNLNIINTHTPETLSLEGTKTWDDNNNQDGIRPENITVRLFANGEEIASKEVNESTNWKYEFTDLPKYENGKEITYTVKEDKVTGYKTTIENTNITNKHTPETISLEGTKTWDDNNNQDGIRPEKITVRLFADGKEITSKEVSETTNWEYKFTDLPKYENGKEITYTVVEDKVSGYETEITGTNIKNTHTPETLSLEGAKTWDDNNNQDGIRPEKITVRLFANDSLVEAKEVTADNNWKYEFTNLPKYKNGKEITYTIKEDKVSGYETEITGTNIKNTHTPETLSLEGTKTWDDNNNQDGIRPEKITVRLLANGKEIASKEVTESTNWKYEFTDLPKYENGKEITYTIKEDKVSGYETEITGTDIKNTHTPETLSLEGTKTWDDNDNQDGIRPEKITVRLLANGKEITSKEVTESANWKYEFTNLPKYENGKEITYTIKEDKVSGYETEITGTDIKNTHTPETLSLEGTKTWDDNNNQDGVRPESITVNLYANNTLIDTIKVTNKDNWKYSFTNLPKYENGKEINYTIGEEEVKDYKTVITGFNIKNIHSPELTDINGKKIWEDNNNQDGLRPASIEVTLLANGEKVATKEVREESNWEYSFTDLPRYKDGQEISYKVEEKAVAGYETKITGTDIINTHAPETISLKGTKTWDDNNNQDGLRPETITVRLLANGKEVANTTAEEKTNWQYSFNDIPKYENGKEITYTITEDSVEGYSTVIDRMNITNTHTPIKMAITGEKVWVDSNNIEGLRPTSITVRLLANGEKVKQVKVTAENNWKYTFEDLDKYSEGQEITYTVKEDAVEHYETSYDKDNKYVIVNTHSPKDITISGKKMWVDSNNRYDRPNSIKVTLTGKVADKIIVEETKEVTNADNWEYEFTNLPEYREGSKIVYTIDETDVKDYDKVITGYDITNIYNPETVNISGMKTWEDNNDQDGVRPEHITINLLANGEKVATTTATAENDWKFEFTNQVVYANGEKINYTVEEVSVDGYTTEITGFDLTNHHTPETVTYQVSKVWNDQDNNDNIRPDTITVRLYADGVLHSVQTIGADNNWTYKFDNLPKYRDGGIEIDYEIVEDEVKGYKTSITSSISETDSNNTTVTITNTHENEKNIIIINKYWNDLNNKYGERPTEITVILNGRVGDKIILSEEITITAEDNWTYILENLDKYLNGEEIIYEIIEKKVANYDTVYDGYNITNNYQVPEEPTIPQTGIEIASIETNNYDLRRLFLITIISLFLAVPFSRKQED